LKQTDEVLILKKQFLSNPEDKNVVFGLAEYYLFTRNAEELKKFIDKALAKYPDDMRTSKLQEEYNKLKDVSTIGVKYKIAYTR
jgi:hypothetical protein